MKGLVFKGNKQAEVREFPIPEPGPDQVLLQMKAAAICGSDLHGYRAKPEDRNPDRIPGHEPSGIVEKVGECVDNVKVGDRVSVFHWYACGHCEQCTKGYYMWCEEARGLGGPIDGSMADKLVVDARNCMPLPDDLSFVDGAFIACIAATSYAALRKMGGSGQETLTIFGMGPVGLTGGLLAQAMGLRVIGVELNPYRIELAQKVGIDFVINPEENDLVEEVNKITNGRGSDFVYETSGNHTARKQTVAVAKKGGKVVYVGFGDPECFIDQGIINKQLTLMGSWVMPKTYYWDLVRLIRENNIYFEQLVTHRFPIEKGVEAMELFDTGQTGKVIFEW